MSKPRPDPFTLPEWQAISREASLVSQIIGSGATALGRASYGNGFGEYYTAFFGLSVGIERLAKLILIADHAMSHAGKLPDQIVVRKFGHKLADLIAKTDQITTRHGLELQFGKPNDPICWAAVDCLNAFADASKGRYANFEAIGNPAFDARNEPVNSWWANVVEPILDKHYRGKSGEAGVKHRAAVAKKLMGQFSSVLMIDEQGGVMTDLEIASERAGQTKWAQKYGRFYTLSVVRWLASIFYELSHLATYQHGIDALFGHSELFNIYRLPNEFLLTRKRWPL